MKANTKPDLHDKIKVGFVSRTHGLKGEIFIRLLNPDPDWPPCIDKLFIGSTTHLVCCFSPHKEGMIVQLKGCENKTLAQALKGLPVFLPKDVFKGKRGEWAYLAELIAFSIETNEEVIGRVHAFSCHKNQDFLLIEPMEKGRFKNSPLLIPFVRPYIKTVDFLKQKIIMDLPPNFLEIFG